MLASTTYRFIFIKTMKTAGTSVEAYFQPACTAPGMPVAHETDAMESAHGIVGRRLRDPDPSPTRFPGHMRPADIRAAVTPAFWEAAFRFTNVRNPFARILSAFFFDAGRKGAEFTSLREAIDAFRARLRDGWLLGDRGMFFLDGAFLHHAVIRFEALAEDAALIARRLGFTPPAPMPVFKPGVPLPFGAEPSDFYDAETRDRMLRKHDWYFERFSYSPDPRDARAVPAEGALA